MGWRLEVNRTRRDRGSFPPFGEMLIECVDDHDHQVSDQIMWAVSGDYDDANSPVTSGSLTSDMGEEWKYWCVDVLDWVSDASVEDERMSALALLQMN